MQSLHLSPLPPPCEQEAADHVHAQYGAWLLVSDDNKNLVAHLDGRDFLTKAQLHERMYQTGYQVKEAKPKKKKNKRLARMGGLDSLPASSDADHLLLTSLEH